MKEYKILESIQFGIANAYRRRSGIYRIYSLTNGKYYIGSAEDFHTRWQVHSCHLRRKTHPNAHLLSHKNKYGIQDLKIEVLEFVDNLENDNLIKREQWWLDNTKCLDREYGFNKCPTAQSVSGIEMPDHHREKIGKRSIGNKYSVGKNRSRETRIKISKLQGNKVAQYSQNGDLIEVFPTLFFAVEKGFSGDCILHCVQKGQKHKGYYWKYIYDDKPVQEHLEYDQLIKVSFKKMIRDVVLTDLDGNFLGSWKSFDQASKETGVTAHRITKMCNGKMDHFRGKRFRVDIKYE